MSGQRRGVALLLVLWLVVVLGAIGASLSVTVRTRTRLAANLHDRAVARAAAESGIVAATAEIEDSLALVGEGPRRNVYLNDLAERAGESRAGDGLFRVSYVDVSARLDVNLASEEALARFFARFTGAVAARDAAHAIRLRTRAEAAPGVEASPFLSLDALREIAALDAQVLAAARPSLTVDGDGSVNLAHAAPAVRLAAAGQIVDAPTRVMLVSRGSRAGGALVHEIEAVYAIQGSQLALVRWRERDL